MYSSLIELKLLHSVDKFALFKSRSNGKFYAARIQSRKGPCHAIIEWYKGNIYSPGDKPPSPTTEVHARACVEALEDAMFNSVVRKNVRGDWSGAFSYNFRS